MNIDFSLVLAIVILVSGSIWAIDVWFFAPKRTIEEISDSENKNLTNEPAIVEFSKFLFPVVVIVFVLRGFIAEPFRIPSGSMLPTLEIGDFILVSKFNYGVRLRVGD